MDDDLLGPLRALRVPSRAVTTVNSAPLAAALDDAALDEILAWQMLVAWAGERPQGGDHPRLGWWDTDLTDKDAGADFLQRLLPRTHAWAGLRAVREAARRTELRAIQSLGGTLRVHTLFCLAPAVDEQLEERVDHFMVRVNTTPADALRWPCPIDVFDRGRFESALRAAGTGAYTVAPNGRELKGAAPKDALSAARALAAALVPLSDAYPMPFYRV
jgi:hypothetical protein